MIGVALTTFIGYQAPILVVLHGFSMGMFIEGAARWGMDKIWQWKYTEVEKNIPITLLMVDDEKVTNPKSIFHHTLDERQRWIEIKAHQAQMRSEAESDSKSFCEAKAASESQSAITSTYL